MPSAATLSFTLNATSAASSFVLDSPATYPHGMHIEYIEGSVVSMLMLLILIMKYSGASRLYFAGVERCAVTALLFASTL